MIFEYTGNDHDGCHQRRRNQSGRWYLTSPGKCRSLPANIELSALEVTMGNVMSREMIMKEYIDAIRADTIIS